jgi:hypothetical protein
VFQTCEPEKKTEISSDGGDSGSKKCKQGYGGAHGRVESAFGGILESGGRFCVGAFGRNLASVAVKMFSHLIYFIKKFHTFCTFNAIFKDSAALNCITVQNKEGPFPSNLSGHTTLVYLIKRMMW